MLTRIHGCRGVVVALLIGLMPTVLQAGELIEIRTADYGPRQGRKPALLVTQNCGFEVADLPEDYRARFRSPQLLDFTNPEAGAFQFGGFVTVGRRENVLLTNARCAEPMREYLRDFGVGFTETVVTFDD